MCFAYGSPIVPKTFVEKNCYFFIDLLLYFCQHLVDYVCVDLFLDFMVQLSYCEITKKTLLFAKKETDIIKRKKKKKKNPYLVKFQSRSLLGFFLFFPILIKIV